MWQVELSFFPLANTKDADQAARMLKLVCAFVVRTQQRQDFSQQGPGNFRAKDIHVLVTLKFRD